MCAGEAEHRGIEAVTKITLRSVFLMKIEKKIYGKVIQSNSLKQVRSISS